MNQHATSTNQVSLRQLGKRVFMSEIEIRKHLIQHSFFQSCESKKWTYCQAVMKLKQDELAHIREQTMQEMEKLNAGQIVRKQSLNDYWQRADPTIVKTGYATV